MKQGSARSAYDDLFEYGLKVEQSYFFVHLCVLLRSMVCSACSELEKGVTAGRGQDLQVWFQVLLLLGRIQWLLLSAPSLGLHAIDPPLSTEDRASDPSRESTHRRHYYSENQLKSAFEIADVDGDGMLDHQEFVEALQALGIHNELMTHSVLKVPSITPSEFFILCSHTILSGASGNSVNKHKFAANIEVLLAHTHASWIEHSVAFVAEPLLGNHWLAIQIPSAIKAGKDLSQALLSLTAAAPVESVSSPLLIFWFEAFRLFYRSFLSMDTAQVPLDSQSTTDVSSAGVNGPHHDQFIDPFYQRLLQSTPSCWPVAALRDATSAVSLEDFAIGFAQRRVRWMPAMCLDMIYEVTSKVDSALDQGKLSAILDLHSASDLDPSSAGRHAGTEALLFDLIVCEKLLHVAMAKVKDQQYSKLLVSLRSKIGVLQKHQPVSHRSTSEQRIDALATRATERLFFLVNVFFAGSDKNVHRSSEGSSSELLQKDGAGAVPHGSSTTSQVFAAASPRLNQLPLPLKKKAK